eukprot:s1201_g2.t1
MNDKEPKPAATQPVQTAPVLQRRISSPSPKPRRASVATAVPKDETQASGQRLKCSNRTCDFLVSDSNKMGSFCCKKCHVHYCGGSKTLKHGPLCQQRLAAPWDQRLSQPVAPPEPLLAPEASLSSAASTASASTLGIPRFGATEVKGPVSCATSEKAEDEEEKLGMRELNETIPTIRDRKSFGQKWGLQLGIWKSTGLFSVLRIRPGSPAEAWNQAVPQSVSFGQQRWWVGSNGM